MSTQALGTQAAQPDRQGLGRWIILLSAGFFATTMAQPAVLRLPFQNLLKADLHVSREAMASFFAIGTSPGISSPLPESFPTVCRCLALAGATTCS